MSRALNLNAFLYFEAVARRGTVTRAADELGVSPSAVSQQIKLLEQQLGVKLFRREGRAVRLTLEGNQLFQTTSSSINALIEAQRDLGRAQEPLRLNLRVTPSLGERWLARRLSGFLDKHPTLELHIDAAPDPSDFDRETIELDIRYGIGLWSEFHSAPILSDHILPLCSPDYLAKFMQAGAPETMLAEARLIDSARAICRWEEWYAQNELSTAPKPQSIRMNRSSMAIQLALDGVGVILESLTLTAKEVTEGRLVPFVPQLPILRFPAYWAICPTRHLQKRPVRSFLGWMEEQVKAHDADVALITAQHGLKVKELAITDL